MQIGQSTGLAAKHAAPRQWPIVAVRKSKAALPTVCGRARLRAELRLGTRRVGKRDIGLQTCSSRPAQRAAAAAPRRPAVALGHHAASGSDPPCGGERQGALGSVVSSFRAAQPLVDEQTILESEGDGRPTHGILARRIGLPWTPTAHPMGLDAALCCVPLPLFAAPHVRCGPRVCRAGRGGGLPSWGKQAGRAPGARVETDNRPGGERPRAHWGAFCNTRTDCRRVSLRTPSGRPIEFGPGTRTAASRQPKAPLLHFSWPCCCSVAGRARGHAQVRSRAAQCA